MHNINLKKNLKTYRRRRIDLSNTEELKIKIDSIELNTLTA